MSDFRHGIRGYKVNKCRCDICSDSHFQMRVRASLRNRKTLVNHVMLDATPIIELYKKVFGSLHSTQRRLVSKWEKNGISAYDADSYCIKLGYHPYEVFGESYFDGLDEEIAQYKKIYGEEADV